jgi:RNA polymerase sigma factor (sigma-70 family)
MVEAKDELIATRTTLLARLKDWGDDSSWQEFFDIYSQLIRNVALKSGLTRAEAEDVVQETMVAAAKHIPAFKYDRKLGSFRLWLLNMSRGRISDQFRRRKKLTTELPDDLADETGQSSALVDEKTLDIDEFWESEWQKTLIEAAINKVKTSLDSEKYQIFDFLVNKQWSPEKVSKRFGISVNQVYLAKHRITELVKKEVERLKEKQP